MWHSYLINLQKNLPRLEKSREQFEFEGIAFSRVDAVNGWELSDTDIEKVYDDIFQEDGSEIYLKPANLYFQSLPIEVTFADMIAVAQKRGEVCIGVKIKSLENDKESNNGITLIPEKNTPYRLLPDDCLCVLAEDEL